MRESMKVRRKPEVKKFKLRYLTAGGTVALAVGVALAWAANPKNYVPTQYDSVKIAQRSQSYVDAVFYRAVSNVGPCEVTKPSDASGFGTNTALVSSTVGCTYAVNVGTASVNGVIGLPVANSILSGATGWDCTAQDITTTNAAAFVTKEIASANNSATIEDFTNTGVAGNWTANDIVSGQCAPY